MTKADPDTVASVLRERIQRYRDAYEARDVDGMVALFADGGEFAAAPGRFRGKAEVRRFLEWDASLSPTTTIRDAGVGVVVAGRTAVWERVISLSYKNVPYQEYSVAIVEFDDDARIVAFRSYYDKLNVLDQIASGLPGLYGSIMRRLVGTLVSAGRKGLATTGTPGRGHAVDNRIWRLLRPQNMPSGFKGWLDAQGMAAGHEPQYAAAMALLDLQPDDDLLEVACGVGALLQRHATGARYVAGLDHSPLQLRFARKRLADRIAAGTAELVLADAGALPWEDGRFSAVVCLNGLELFPDPEKVLFEMRRVLRAGGRAVFSMGMRFQSDAARARFTALDFWAPGEEEVRQVLRDAGFAHVEISYHRWGRGLSGPLADRLSRAMLGSDEDRLVSAVAE